MLETFKRDGHGNIGHVSVGLGLGSFTFSKILIFLLMDLQITVLLEAWEI
jgi:hypothetical protein